MLSKEAKALLRWFDRNDDWWFQNHIERIFPGYDYRLLEALVESHLVDHAITEESMACPKYDESFHTVFPRQYRINDKGRAYLESLHASRWKEIRAWVTLAIAAAALVVSIIALFQPLQV